MRNVRVWLTIVLCMAVVICSMLAMSRTRNGGDTPESAEDWSMVSQTAAVSHESTTEQKTTMTTTAKKTEPTTVTETTAATETVSEPLWININTAGISELCRLNGIGEVTASKVTEYRDANGGFNNIEELMLVEGIGEKTFAAIRDYVYVDDPVYPEFGTEEPETESDPTSEQVTEPLTVAVTATESATSVPETTRVLTLEEICPIDLNTATADELMLLPHVTEDIAESILELRRKIGGFSHPYELLYVDELEQNQVADILEFVIVGQ